MRRLGAIVDPHRVFSCCYPPCYFGPLSLIFCQVFYKSCFWHKQQRPLPLAELEQSTAAWFGLICYHQAVDKHMTCYRDHNTQAVGTNPARDSDRRLFSSSKLMSGDYKGILLPDNEVIALAHSALARPTRR